MPEYNYSFSAPLKNAIDYLNREWAYKPVGFVSYGGVSGGLRAVQMIKQVVTTLRMTPVVDAVVIPMVRTMINDNGGFEPTDIVLGSTKAMLDELVKYGRAMAAMRADG
jgi:NAD(P)H-dependent FMN reductase